MLYGTERLLLSRTIPPEDKRRAGALLRPSMDKLRVYFDKRQEVLDAAEIDTGPSSLSDEEVLVERDIQIDIEQSAEFAVITGNGDFLLGPWYSLHLDDISTPGDVVVNPRVQLSMLAQRLAGIDPAERHKFVVATTYPKLARLAQKLTGMEYALATYFPPTVIADQIPLSIFRLENLYRAKNQLKRAPYGAVESLFIPTEEFIENVTL